MLPTTALGVGAGADAGEGAEATWARSAIRNIAVRDSIAAKDVERALAAGARVDGPGEHGITAITCAIDENSINAREVLRFRLGVPMSVLGLKSGDVIRVTARPGFCAPKRRVVTLG